MSEQDDRELWQRFKQASHPASACPDFNALAAFADGRVLGTELESLVARAQNVTVVAQRIKPDWLSVANEPDTEQSLSGQPIDNVTNYPLLINTISPA